MGGDGRTNPAGLVRLGPGWSGLVRVVMWTFATQLKAGDDWASPGLLRSVDLSFVASLPLAVCSCRFERVFIPGLQQPRGLCLSQISRSHAAAHAN